MVDVEKYIVWYEWYYFLNLLLGGFLKKWGSDLDKSK